MRRKTADTTTTSQMRGSVIEKNWRPREAPSSSAAS